MKKMDTLGLNFLFQWPQPWFEEHPNHVFDRSSGDASSLLAFGIYDYGNSLSCAAFRPLVWLIPFSQYVTFVFLFLSFFFVGAFLCSSARSPLNHNSLPPGSAIWTSSYFCQVSSSACFGQFEDLFFRPSLFSFSDVRERRNLFKVFWTPFSVSRSGLPPLVICSNAAAPPDTFSWFFPIS